MGSPLTPRAGPWGGLVSTRAHLLAGTSRGKAGFPGPLLPGTTVKLGASHAVLGRPNIRSVSTLSCCSLISSAYD